MLFVALAKSRPGTSREATARRLQWQYPDGMRVVAEYWLQTSDPAVIIVAEGDSVVPIMVTIAQWDDVFDITVIPAITAEEGLELAKLMAQA